MLKDSSTFVCGATIRWMRISRGIRQAVALSCVLLAGTDVGCQEVELLPNTFMCTAILSRGFALEMGT